VRAAASKALEIDPLAGEAHIALALPLVQDFQWREAGQRFRKGLDLAPSDAFGHAWYGMYLATMGRPTDALKEQELAVQLDPASPVTACCHGQTLYLLRCCDDAGHCFRRALALAPSLPRAHAGLGLSLLQQGNHAQAIAELEQALALTPGLGRVKADLGYAYALSGNREKAREILNEFLKLFRPSAFPALMIAEIYIGLGEDDMAFQWLNKAFDQKDLAPFLTCDPLFDPLRPDPRFSGLLKGANLL
jgi:adenylate cyclase